ncbi:class I SAM-dependent methyltransferase [Microbacterium sp. SLBN-146]|uniref:class I SAM-dependent methyltransferase n=1 Tax=Microbacterium sp. SLBN-146 TaxID=2768457 RepID=UPI001150C8BC|nr:methyltransferase domain-containing protein [Microbacterium sp. SLBN-146]TQJ30945.1 methyltransferase family protein [Microbacterium sp. SLBN-146]
MATLLKRYGAGARWYDVLSGERWIYGAGRAAGMDLLAPQRDEVVVDLGCGTGLNFPALADAVGPEGLVVGIDRSGDMLAMAERRIDAHGWRDRVRLVTADAATLDPALVGDVIAAERGRRHADALLTTYALSVIDEREEAWRRARSLLRIGGRACVVDMQPPTGRWRILSPLARLACAAGGSDIRSRAWRLVEQDAAPGSIRRTERKGGHIVALAGVLSPGPREDPNCEISAP